MAGMGYDDAENGEGLYMKTTDEMMAEFAYLGDRTREVVIENTNYIASLVDGEFSPVPAENSRRRLKARRILCETPVWSAHTRSTAIRSRKKSKTTGY